MHVRSYIVVVPFWPLGRRCHNGQMLRGQSIWYGHVANSLTMEAVAIRDGVQIASTSGITRVVIETDEKEVVKLYNDRNQGRSEIMAIIQEIEELSGHLEFFQLNFVGREANEGAHLCAKQASESRRRCMWINFLPSFLVQCLQNDCNPADY